MSANPMTTIPGNIRGGVAAAALATTAAFAAGCVLTQVVTVAQWRRMTPEAFLQQFASSGPATGAVLFPTGIASLSLLAVMTYSTARRGGAGRVCWMAATLSMAGTVLLLPIYFAEANGALLDPAFPPDAVADALAAWQGWNWLRTGLAVAATMLGCGALTLAGAPSKVRQHKVQEGLDR